MTEPCMCGAIDCQWCGPLQGFPIGWEEEEEDVHDDLIHGVEPYSFDHVWREDLDE